MDFTCSAESCPASTSLSLLEGGSESSALLKLSTLFLLLGFQGDTNAIITNVSVIQSWRWFFHLSPFESVFLGLIIAEIGALSLLGILPINLPQLWHGMSSGRRKREVSPHVAFATKEIGSKMLRLYKKLDQNECGFRALCELQSKVSCGDYDKRQLPRATRLVLTTLLSYAKRTHKMGAAEQDGTSNEDSMEEILQPYVEAVQIGSENPTFPNSTENTSCQRKYSGCPATSEDIIDYVERITILDY